MKTAILSILLIGLGVPFLVLFFSDVVSWWKEAREAVSERGAFYHGGVVHPGEFISLAPGEAIIPIVPGRAWIDARRDVEAEIEMIQAGIADSFSARRMGSPSTAWFLSDRVAKEISRCGYCGRVHTGRGETCRGCGAPAALSHEIGG